MHLLVPLLGLAPPSLAKTSQTSIVCCFVNQKLTAYCKHCPERRLLLNLVHQWMGDPELYRHVYSAGLNHTIDGGTRILKQSAGSFQTYTEAVSA